MIKIFALIFTLSLGVNALGSAVQNPKSLKVFTTSREPSKLLFETLEYISAVTGIPIGLEFATEEALLESMKEGRRVDILITPSYELLASLKDLGFVNFTYVEEMFYDKLVTVYIDSDTKAPEDAIFFKTSQNDNDIFNEAGKIPSVVLESSKRCKKIETLSRLYQGSYKYFVIKESAAKKCELKRAGYFDHLYDIYYVALIMRENNENAVKVMRFASGSKKIKGLIRSMGYGA